MALNSDIEVAAAERKTPYSESVPGVVIVTLSSMEDKKNVRSKKLSVKSSRRYKDVFIHSDQSKQEILMSSNLRSLINAYKSGDNNVHMRGSKL